MVALAVVVLGALASVTAAGLAGTFNTLFDALDDGTGTGNMWIANVFGTTSGI